MSHLDTRILALHPNLLDVGSAWIGHLPFAFWLIDAIRPDKLVELGTHGGVSYCAFCQAITELKLSTVAHAIDTWQGDSHTGDYPSDTYFKLKSHHDSRYAAFSDLVRTTFDNAAPKFADGSIDLLHIDGLHTYDAVSHDFETWRAKLSDRAVVLFHDTNVFERDFGVQEFWRSVSSEFPSFEFKHGHGLGVLAVGKEQSDAIRWLTSLAAEEQREVRTLFANAAQPLQNEAEATAELEQLRETTEQLQRQHDHTVEALESAREHASQIAAANTVLHEHNEELAAASQTLSTNIESMRAEQKALSAENADERARLSALQKDHAESSAQHAADLAALTNHANKLESDMLQLLGSSSWRLTRPWRYVGTLLKGKSDPHTLPRVVARTLRQPGGVTKAVAGLRERGLSGSLNRVNDQINDAQIRTAADLRSGEVDEPTYALWVAKYDTLTDKDRQAATRHFNQLSHAPVISIVMPVYNTRPDFLAACLDSVLAQLYTNWELCIADDASPNAEVQQTLTRYAARDTRIKVCYRDAQGGISVCSNSALELASGEFVALLDHDDLLPEHALGTVVDALNTNSQADILYSDEDKIDEHGLRHDPYFKTDFNYELLLGQNCISHLGVFRTSLLRKIGGFRAGYDGSQDHDLALRAVAASVLKSGTDKIVHIPHVLYHWRVFGESGSFSTDYLPASMQAATKAIEEHLQDTDNTGARVTAAGVGSFQRVQWQTPAPHPSVAIIIPTRDNAELLKPCIDGLLNNTHYDNFEILIVDNGSAEPTALTLLAALEEHSKVRVLPYDQPFNYSELNNYAATQTDAELLCLLNDDIQVIEPDWLAAMVALACREGIGAVGARLLYPDDTVQHGGVILGIMGVANHLHKDLPVDSPGYFGRLQLCQEMSAVTAACLVIRSSIYSEVGGLNAAELAVAFNDVDFCLRVRKHGYRNLWTPAATLYHMESASRGSDMETEKRLRFEGEVTYMQETWAEELQNDKFYNPNLTLETIDLALAFPPRAVLPWRQG